MVPFDNNKIICALDEFETNDTGGLLKLRRHGFYVWPIVRIHASFDVISKRTSPESSVNSGQVDNSKNVNKSYFTRTSLKKDNNVENIYIYDSSQNYKVCYEGVCFDRVMIGELNKKHNSSLCEVSFDGGSDEIYSTDLWISVGVVPKILMKVVSFVLSSFFVLDCLKIYRFLAVFYSFSSKSKVCTIFDSIKINAKISYVFLNSKYISYLIRGLSLNRVATANFYRADSMALTLMAHNKKVPTFNFQHGVQSSTHPAFSDWKNIPLGGYELIPNVFNCWDKESCAQIDSWGVRNGSHKSFLMGNQWIKYWKTRTASDLLDYSKSGFTIVVTLHPSIGLLPEVLSSSIKYGDPDWRWLIRLHPRQMTQNNIDYVEHKIESVGVDIISKVNVCEASNLPLPLLLSRSDVHMTGFSSSALEASEFNVKTIFIHRMGGEYYPGLIERGQAVYSPNMENILFELSNLSSAV